MQKPPGWTEFQGEEQLPDIYADAVNLDFGVYGWTLTFGSSRRDTSPKAAARLRISPQLTKVLFLLLRKQLKQYENSIGRIDLPTQLAESIGLGPAETEVV